MLRIVMASLLLASCGWAKTSKRSKEIKHRFLGVDESGSQLVYVDQFKPSKGWAVKIQGNSRDSQLIGGGKVLLSTAKGYYEVNIKDGSVVKEYKGQNGIMTARRTTDGRTFLGKSANGITIVVLDKKDEEIKTINVPSANNLRLMRLTAKNTILLGANKNVVEIDMDGKILRDFQIPGGKHIYKAVYLPNGQLVTSAGYGGFVAFVDKKDEVLKKVGEDAKEQGKNVGFFADFQILKNGNIVTTNWHGHGRSDSKKGAQLLEFDKNGKLVWSWHDSDLAGCLHGIIVLDKVNPKYLYNDTKGIMSPAKKSRSRRK